MSIRWPWWSSGAIALLLIAGLTLLPMAAMFLEAGSIEWRSIFANSYLQSVVRFSVSQAILSTLLALLTAIPVALALSHKPAFTGRSLIISVFSLSLVIPTIVAIYGIVAVFGRSGWLNELLAFLSIQPVGLYGLPGILIAHVFFNMPLATRIFLNSLETIPEDNWRLCKQLGMSPWAIFRFVEWDRLRNQLPGLALLIFTLCFTSFAIIMTLGGGPRSTTIEVAIYQALRFEFDITQAVALASIQLVICLALMALSTVLRHNSSMDFHAYIPLREKKSASQVYAVKQGLWRGTAWNLIHWGVIITASSFVFLPLLALTLSALNGKTLSVLTDASTLQAMSNTIIVSLCAAGLSVSLALSLLVSTRHMRIRLHQERRGQWLQLTGNIILVLPPLVLGTGLFLLLRPFADVFSIALVLVVIINSLMALPFVLRILDGPMMSAASQQDRLLQSLGIHGLNRWRFIDWVQLRKPLALSLALATTLSAGDLSAIALFGSERVRTLPLLLYQRMGSYRLEEAAVTAGLLLLLCLTLFAIIQRLLGGGNHAAA
ncbi:thiamine/thiamine pyrophosphate ABC transporter permease [Granulosicoccus antarcticus]|uniref:Thiamine transport system permease protein ThiP n=1 Tax=Granulosicoccus antarcticus IMCC3135 TaxID=1192854 RepID=A0A2Z2P9B6_9GAMM|nr:thiamine/thiamine pyrophosphate ABC transporter permease [Granulosicoccus antarcticus]ASJ76484.1 Sulfate transport system permease protein CysW [Granulosicoccus antarcticus IMCC3135]